MKKIVRELFKWAFRSELMQLESQIHKMREQEYRINKVLEGIDVSVDIEEYIGHRSRSWAVISIQGEKSDFIKFVDLGDSDIRQIELYLRQFEKSRNVKIDARPSVSNFLRVKK